MTSEYFRFYVECNGFDYHSENDSLDEFEELADHLNWGDAAYNRNKREFLQIRENQQNETDSQTSVESFDQDSFNSIDEYFSYFRRNYQFKPRKRSPLGKFEELASFMGWNRKKTSEWQKIKRIRDETMKQEYVEALFEKYDVDYDENCSFKENFDHLCDLNGWNNYYHQRRDEFNHVIRVVTKVRLSNLPDLHAIIIRYGKQRTLGLPRTIKKCRELIKANIFVNIYDFIDENDNNTQFNNVSDLSEYTVNNDKIFPKEDAKADEILTVLMHVLRIRSWKKNYNK